MNPIFITSKEAFLSKLPQKGRNSEEQRYLNIIRGHLKNLPMRILIEGIEFKLYIYQRTNYEGYEWCMLSAFMCLPGYLAQPTEKDYEYTYQFEKEYAILKKEVENGNYNILFSWTPSHLRFRLLETYCKHPNIQLKDFKVWEEVYINAEEHYQELITLLPYFTENRPKLRHKKPIVQVYRGVNNYNAGLAGYSWTTNREIAEGFALRYYKTRGEALENFPDALVYVGTVSLQHILAEIYAGGECELLIPPSHVEITKCIPATDFKYREQVENRHFLF